VLGVDGIIGFAPLEESERSICDTRVNRLSVLRLPNDERIVLTDAGQELVVGGELQFQNLALHSAKNGHRFARLHVPKDDWGVGLFLEHSSFLASCDDVARVRNSDR